MYHDEAHHKGRPHFHARYGDHEASVDIESFEIIAGSLPTRAKRLVVEWASERQSALRANWERARRHEALVQVDPLV